MEDAVNLIHKSLRGLPELNKLSLVNKHLFSVDLAFVALALRTGYLVDVILPKDPVSLFVDLLQILHRTSPLFRDVTHIFDSISNQSFLVNRLLLSQRLRRLSDIQFISLPTSDSCQLFQGVPADVQEALHQLALHLDLQDIPLSVPLPICDLTAAVPIAAVLVEYPIAYVPGAVTSFLHRVPLDVYECIVKFNSHTRSLLKFSCPAVLGEKQPDKLSPDRVRTDLQVQFGGEARFGKWKEVQLQVTHHVEMHERVAL